MKALSLSSARVECTAWKSANDVAMRLQPFFRECVGKSSVNHVSFCLYGHLNRRLPFPGKITFIEDLRCFVPTDCVEK